MKIAVPNRRQLLILPPSVDEYVGPKHRVRVIVEVVDHLDLSRFDVGASEEGRPAFPPKCLVSLLFYAFSVGVFSAREMERRCQSDCTFMFATAGLRPSHRTISRFRARYENELADLFTQVVAVCRQAGLGNTARVAVDGTRQRANASIDAHVRKEQLEKELTRIRHDITKLLDEMGRIDAEEDRDPELAESDDVIPECLADTKARKQAIAAAVKEMQEADKADSERSKAPDCGQVEEGVVRSLEKTRERERAIEAELKKLEESQQKESNKTDPDARLQRFKEGSRPGYNAQIAATAEDGLIVACDVTQDAGDTEQLLPMCKQVESNTGQRPGVVVADAGYESGENFQKLAEQGQDAVVASACAKAAHKARERTGLYQWVDFHYDADRDEYVCPAGKRLVRVGSHDGEKPRATYEGVECAQCPLKGACTRAEKRRLTVLESTPHLIEMSRRRQVDRETEQLGAKRKAYVEPRFGHMKHNLRWRQFVRRGLRACRSEFRILCAAIDLSKLAAWLHSGNHAIAST